MERRTFLKTSIAGSIPLISGCTGVLEEENDQINPEVQDAREDIIENSTSNETSSEIEEETETEEETGPEPPEPDYTVAKDGSGDYSELSEAVRIAQGGDVLGLKSGSYIYQPKYQSGSVSHDKLEKNLTLIGEGRGRTTVEWVPESFNEDGGGSRMAFTNTDKILEIGRRMTDFWNLTLSYDDSILIQTSDPYFSIVDSRVNGNLYFRKGDITNTVFDKRIVAHSTNYHGCSYNKAVKVGERGQFQNCTFNETVFFGYREGSEFVNCMFDPSSSDIAISASDKGDRKFIENTIKGQLANGGWDESTPNDNVFSPNTFIKNRFDAEGKDFDFFIDLPGPDRMWGNAFIGADVRFSGGVRLYHEDAEVGNYYGEWSGGEDEDGDGISDLPRPVPGNGENTDQYPLMNPDLEQYDIPLP